MVDFIDPTLRSSDASRQGQKSASIRFLLALLCFLGGLLALWVIFVFYHARIDTTPNKSIEIDDRINKIQFDGRIPTIPTTVGSSSSR